MNLRPSHALSKPEDRLGGQLSFDLDASESQGRNLPKWGFWTLNTRRDGEAMKQRPYQLHQMEFVLQNINPEVDSYMSQCVFSQPNRRALNVSSITHAYVDLDTYNMPELNGLTTKQIEGLIALFCNDEGIPPPSYTISSGRGIYLKWAWTAPLPRQAAGRCVAVNRALVQRFSRFGADPKSVDISRILRVLGTRNTKNGNVVELLHMNYTGDVGLSYDFEMFADEVLPYTLQQIKEFRSKNAEIKILSHEKMKRDPVDARRWDVWHWGVIEDMRLLMKLRNWNTVPIGMIDTFGHLGACQLAQIFPASQLWHEIHTWSRICLPSFYVDRDLKNHASTLMDRAKRAAKGEKVEFNGGKKSPIYAYSKDRMIDMLEVTSGEMKQLGFLIDSNEKNSRRRVTGLDRNAWLKANNTSAQKPWENLSMSRATWYRLGKPVA